MGDDTEGEVLSNLVRIDDERIRDHLGEIMRSSVDETLNALLDAEADRLCDAGRYERPEARRDTRAGSYTRKLQTKAGEVALKVPQLRRQIFERAIIERCRRRETSVGKALIEMYLAGASVRRVEEITEALWSTRVSPSTVSRLNQRIYGEIAALPAGFGKDLGHPLDQTEALAIHHQRDVVDGAEQHQPTKRRNHQYTVCQGGKSFGSVRKPPPERVM